jgi:hypothetical protein
MKEAPVLARPSRDGMQPVGLCGVPFRELEAQAAKELSGLAATGLDTADHSREEEEVGEYQHQQTQLWVEKYKPRCAHGLLCKKIFFLSR